MAALVLAVAVWLMAIPATWSVPTARGLILLGFALAVLEHRSVIAAGIRDLKSLAALVTVVLVTLALGIYAHRATGPVLSDAVRQLFALAFFVGMVQLLRSAYFASLFLACFALCGALAWTIGVYFAVSGIGWGNLLDYQVIKQAKYELFTTSRIGFNTLAYSIAAAGMLVAAVSGIRLVRYAAIAAAVLAAWLMGSTNTLAALILAMVVATGMSLSTRWMRIPAGVLAVVTLALLVAILLLVIAAAVQTPWLLEFLSDLTTGRLHLWVIALDVFQSNLVFGAGPFSWREDLLTGIDRLGEDPTRYEQISGGAYHSIFLTTLAERGLIGAVAATFILVAILKLCALAMGSRKTAAMAVVVLFGTLRGIGEYSGVLSYMQAVSDFVFLVTLAFLAAAVMGVRALPAGGELAPQRASQRTA